MPESRSQEWESSVRLPSGGTHVLARTFGTALIPFLFKYLATSCANSPPERERSPWALEAEFERTRHVEAIGEQAGIWGSFADGFEAWAYPIKLVQNLRIEIQADTEVRFELVSVGLLGLRVEVPARTIEISPWLPPTWDRLRVERIPVGEHFVTLEIRQSQSEWSLRASTDSPESLRLECSPSLPAGCVVDEIIDFTKRRGRREVTLRSTPTATVASVSRYISKGEPTEIRLPHRRGVELFILESPLRHGRESHRLRLIRYGLEDGTYRLDVEGRRGESYILRFYTPEIPTEIRGAEKLRELQRRAILRASCSDEARTTREAKRVEIGELKSGSRIEIDAYNLLITVESALSTGVVLVSRDGAYRDIASIHGTYRRVEETVPALVAIGETLARVDGISAHWLIDAPVSNSGRLRAILDETATEHRWSWTAELVPNPDPILSASKGIVASSDSVIVDRCTHCIWQPEF